LVNKWDGLGEDQKEQVKKELARRLHFAHFAKIRFISALHGSGVGGIFKDIKEAYASAIQTFSTPKVTRLLQDLTTQHTPPLVNGRRIKLRYAHTGGQSPPIIVIHGNQHLGLVGTPLKLEFKSSDNPFKGKKNKLNARQLQRRKRLVKHVKKR
jgi:GTP-binding protein